MLTEEEAKTKWCPMARVVTYDALASEFDAGTPVGMCAANRSIGKISADAKCIGSACMAWQWGMPPARKRGVCGLAVKP